MYKAKDLEAVVSTVTKENKWLQDLTSSGGHTEVPGFPSLYANKSYAAVLKEWVTNLLAKEGYSLEQKPKKVDLYIKILFSYEDSVKDFIPEKDTAYYMFNGRREMYNLERLTKQIRSVINYNINIPAPPAGLKRGKIMLQECVNFEENLDSILYNGVNPEEFDWREELAKKGINSIFFKDNECFLYDQTFFDCDCIASKLVERGPNGQFFERVLIL